MRLADRQHQAIQKAARRAFGADARVYLFGSRIDNRARGGDFDLYVVTPESDPERLVAARLAFLQMLHAEPALEDEKIDVVLSTPLHGGDRCIDEVARQEGVEL